jgi:hypothetical protein
MKPWFAAASGMSILILQGKLSNANEGQSDFDLEQSETQNTAAPPCRNSSQLMIFSNR